MSASHIPLHWDKLPVESHRLVPKTPGAFCRKLRLQRSRSSPKDFDHRYCSLNQPHSREHLLRLLLALLVQASPDAAPDALFRRRHCGLKQPQCDGRCLKQPQCDCGLALRRQRLDRRIVMRFEVHIKIFQPDLVRRRLVLTIRLGSGLNTMIREVHEGVI